jgi:hypothetical protein
MWKIRYAWSLLIAIVLIAVVGAIASIPGCSSMWLVLLPGAFLAAVVFPQGVNSHGGNLYLVLAGVLDITLLAFLVMWVWNLIEQRREPKDRI